MAMQIPGYRVIRKINQGGMSTVYLAIQISVGRVVALKVMNPQLNADPAFSERFQREATIVGQLSHPNIVSIYDIGRYEDLNYIAMDYLPNGSIQDRMSQGLSAEEALRITKEIANALDHAHEKGYIHRDIKPENILFRADNSAVLSDFGVARGLAMSSRMTHVGTVVGTPHYMSPEQTKGQNVDGRSDLYSLGIVLYEMLTGTLPFQGDEAVTIALKHISAPIPKLPMQYLAYQKLLDKLLDKNPEQRFQRGRDVAQAIDSFYKNPNARTSTPAYTSDQTVFNLMQALALATGQSIRWRLNQLKKIRWSNNKGFYYRNTTRITEIFFNEQQEKNSARAIDRKLLKTKTHASITPQRKLWKIMVISLSLVTMGFISLLTYTPSTAPPALDASKNDSTSMQEPLVLDKKPIENIHIKPSDSNSATSVENIQTETLLTQSAKDQEPAQNTIESAESNSQLNIQHEAATTTNNLDLPRYSLAITTQPQNARIRIMNIAERYQNNMQLAAGAYDVEVSAAGYETARKWIEITDSDKSEIISLTTSITPSHAKAATTAYPEMIQIPAGSFYMGNKDDSLSTPVHKVTIKRAFSVSKFEITFANYDAFCAATGHRRAEDNRWGRGNRPAINISYNDALAYTAWLTQSTGKKYRLPTESEWEYVARANVQSHFWWGDQAADAIGRANCRRGCRSKFSGLFGSKTAPVGSYPANGFGVFDTAGNVSEWVQDCFAENYRLHPSNGLAYDVKNCRARSIRGGSAKSNVQQITSDSRDYFPPDLYNENLGFRVVMELN